MANCDLHRQQLEFTMKEAQKTFIAGAKPINTNVKFYMDEGLCGLHWSCFCRGFYDRASGRVDPGKEDM
jgi:hypothetical protein